MTPLWRYFYFSIAAVLLIIAFIRDARYEKLYPGDLRNRVVGARLIYDGKSPYFYKWQPQDGMRYYDPDNFNNTIISNTTASPFLHELVLPFCNLSQRTISLIWLYGQYAIIICMGLLAFRYSGQSVTLLLAAVFPYTDGWIRHILTGQFYLLVPLLMFIIYILLSKQKSPMGIAAPNVFMVAPPLFGPWIAALLAVMVVLVRPFGALFFIPMLFILPQTRKFIIACFAIGVAYALFVLANPFQRELYKDYNQFIKYSVREHQQQSLAFQDIAANPGFRDIEGFDIAAIMKSKARDSIQSRSENGNFFVLYKGVFKEQLPQSWLLAGSLLSTLLIVLIFYFGTAHGSRSLYQCMLAGFVIYMVLEMFLPIHRHQYNTVQFLFPLLLAGMHARQLRLLPTILITCGLLLNIIKWEVFPMKDTAGELLMLAGFLLAVTRPRGNPAQY
jgi:hypothetical protein